MAFFPFVFFDDVPSINLSNSSTGKCPLLGLLDASAAAAGAAEGTTDAVALLFDLGTEIGTGRPFFVATAGFTLGLLFPFGVGLVAGFGFSAVGAATGFG